MCVCAGFQPHLESLVLDSDRSVRAQGLDFPRALGTAGWCWTTGKYWKPHLRNPEDPFLSCCPSFGTKKTSAWWFVDVPIKCSEYILQIIFQRKPLVFYYLFCYASWALILHGTNCTRLGLKEAIKLCTSKWTWSPDWDGNGWKMSFHSKLLKITLESQKMSEAFAFSISQW